MSDPASTDISPAQKAISSAAELADWIRERIRTGFFVPGQRLVEADITRATSVSRTKVREAFQRLNMEGLIELAEFKGATVKRLSKDDVRQIYMARMALEGLAAREFAARNDADSLKAELVELQAHMNELEEQFDHENYARLNSKWHTLVIEGSQNHYVAQFLSLLTIPIYRLLFSTFYKVNRTRAANADHRLITDAIRDGRPDDAEAAMRNHILNGLNALSDINSDFFA